MESVLSEAGSALSGMENIPSEAKKQSQDRKADAGKNQGSGADSGKEKAVKSQAGTDTGKKPGGKKMLVLCITACAAVLAAAGLILFLVLRGGKPGDGESLTADGKSSIQPEDGDAAEDGNEPEEEIPLYHIADVNAIDIYARNVVPGEKVQGIIWDNTLFYWLEDVSRESQEDGYLARCRISKALLRDSEGGGLIQYEVYRDPATSEIYKIVSIEQKGDTLVLTDYYYQNGIPNFIFAREDSIYTPTYATTDKSGERYYFAGNVMAKWRIIQTPGEIGEYTLTLTDTYYTQTDYFQEEEGIRNIYDETESRMLNAAYNTYNAIMSQTPVGLAEGVVRDTTGAGISGVSVEIRRKEDNVLLYRTVTGEDGAFQCFVYLDGTECVLSVSGDETFRNTTVYGIFLADSGLTGAYGNLVLHRVAGDEYPVHINVYTAEDVRSGDDGSLSRSPVGGVSVSLREGVGAYEGDIVRALQGDEGGKVDTTLPSGTYTAQIDVPGYTRSFLEIQVDEGETTADSYILPAIAEGTTGVVLTWEGGETDLDLTLFTPFQSTGGDMARVGGRVMDDGYGNRLLSDNSAGCEVMYVNTAQDGSYKVYVNDYTDSQAGNYTVSTLANINIHIYIYDSNGFVAEYTFPVGQTGVVWEVAEISGRQITPSQRVYSRMEGKSWWLESKEVWMAEEDARLLELLNSGNSNLSNLMEALVHVNRVFGHDINAILQGTEEGIEEFFGLDGTLGPVVEHVIWKIQSDEWEMLSDPSVGSCYVITEKLAENLFYSASGRKMDIDFSGYDRWNAPYIRFEMNVDNTWNMLENFSVERVNANTWKVMAMNSVGRENALSIPVSRVCFTVVRNSNSYFDGYSLTGFAVEEEADMSWARAYYDYLTKDPEGIAMMEYGFGSGWQEYDYPYVLIYVDGDLVPEIYLKGRDWASGDALLHFHDGKVIEAHFSDSGGNYLPYTGLMLDGNSKSGGIWEDIYKLENGEMTMIGGWYGHSSDIDPETGYPIETDPNEPIVVIKDGFKLNGVEVTQEQYEETINSYLGGAELQPCILYGQGQNQDLISYLEFLMSYADINF